MPVRLLSLQSPGILEDARTENLSTGGARVRTTQALKPEETLLLASARDPSQIQARVVYCKRLGERSYAVGLRFESQH